MFRFSHQNQNLKVSRTNIDFGAEYKFSMDLLSCVMQQYLPGWRPISLMKQNMDIASYFKPNICKVIEHIIDTRIGHCASLIFDDWFKTRDIELSNFRLLGETLTVDFCMEHYRSETFLEICALVGELSALAYIYGVVSAPHYAIIYITHMIRYFKNNNQFFDHSWLKLDKRAKFMLASEGIFPANTENPD